MLARPVVLAGALVALAAAPAAATLPGGIHAGSVVRFVALHPEQARSLRDAGMSYGLTAGLERGRLGFAAELTTGGATAYLGIDGVPDPDLRIWNMTGTVQVRPIAALPLYALGGGGLWRLDYRDETLLLAFPGVEPIPVEFDDVNAPLLTAGAGVGLTPRPWLHLGVEGGVLGLRLNETRLDGTTLSIEPHWRLSPTAAAHLAFAF